jgi:hypothetical protein
VNECTATRRLPLNGDDIVVICDLGEHRGETHWDAVFGEWVDEGGT